jgi:hypothetical protein
MPASWNRNRLTEKLGIGAIARAGAALLLKSGLPAAISKAKEE